MARDLQGGQLPARHRPSAQPTPAAPRAAASILALMLVLCMLSAPAMLAAQGEDQNVHIRPRTPATGVTPPPSADVDPSLRTHTRPLKVDVDLVLINVTITDPMNRLVTGLERDNFQVFEGNDRQEIRHFSSEDAPISMGVILDISGSMNNKMEKAREAVVEFLKTSNPEDEFFLVTFSDRPELLVDFTTSIEDVQAQLIYAIPKGRTALLDAIYKSVHRMREARHNKKALLIISDGGDNRSRYTDREIRSLVREADVQIYAIGIFDLAPGTVEERMGPSMLSEVTDVTGGRTFTLSDVNELADVATKIGIELRNQYVLGYRPKNEARDGRWRRVRVRLQPPKGLPPLNVYAKSGYYAPQE